MNRARIIVCILLAAFAATPAGANEDLERSLAKAKYLLKSLQKENQSLKVERATLVADLAAAQSDRDALAEDKKDLERQLDAANTQIDDLGTRLDVSEVKRERAYERIELLTEKLREHVDVLKRTVVQRNRLEVDLEDTTAARDDCEFKNRKLYEANVEMTRLYEAKGTDDALAQREPFTGLKQAEIENLLEEYRRKIAQFEVSSGKPR